MARESKVLRKEAAALSLASGHTIKATAAAIHVGERTVHGWFKEKEFRDRVAEIQTQMFESALGLLTSMTSKASLRLYQLMDSPNEPTALGACKAVLENASRLREVLHLSREQAEIKQLLAKVLHEREANAG
jgi:hypothetical protein